MNYTIKSLRKIKENESSCDNCFYQEGRHYCHFHGEALKNMDIVRCDDYKYFLGAEED